MPGLKTVNGIMTAGGSKAAWFKDTEGNIMAVIAVARQRLVASDCADQARPEGRAYDGSSHYDALPSHT